jgi:hypothetical protein
MRMKGALDREKEAARVVAWHATLTWRPLADRYPERCAAVLVRMADGRVLGAHWDGRGWIHSPFETWGEAVEWAALPGLHRTP